MRRTSTRPRRALGALVLVVAASISIDELTGSGPMLLGGGDAHAVIGRPLTPGSYAGHPSNRVRGQRVPGGHPGRRLGGGDHHAARRLRHGDRRDGVLPVRRGPVSAVLQRRDAGLSSVLDRPC